ncbi:S-methyl thiohydantoin desulfurase domain-containing protein, partial [Escherichia coli]|uniref:S-methyl thiohydantoin desulfurase domain-containing protein n=1 Tax=Escherichia coli TaxID=562 RepID=UPI0013D6A860
LELSFQNEWIVAWQDGEPIAMSPDLICVLDSVTGEAVGTETIRYGQRVTVIALPPPPVFLTPAGLAYVGPRA